MIIKPKQLSLPFITKEKEAKDIYSFYFNLAKDPEYTFSAGQYVRMLLHSSHDDPRGRSRMFTICSSPHEKNTLMITTKIGNSPSIFKQKMMTLKKDEEVFFFGPMGGFILPENTKRPLVFLSGGVGITPFHSMILYANSINYKTPITLFASFRSRDEIVFYKNLLNIQKSNPLIQVIYTISHSEDIDSKWTGEIGRIDEDLLKKNILNIWNANYYIAGSPTMVGTMLDLLDSLDIPSNQIFEEQLMGY